MNNNNNNNNNMKEYKVTFSIHDPHLHKYEHPSLQSEIIRANNKEMASLEIHKRFVGASIDSITDML
jgi:hypothetical protein